MNPTYCEWGAVRSVIMTLDLSRGLGRKNRIDVTETRSGEHHCPVINCVCRAVNYGLLNLGNMRRRCGWDRWDDCP